MPRSTCSAASGRPYYEPDQTRVTTIVAAVGIRTRNLAAYEAGVLPITLPRYVAPVWRCGGISA